MPRRTLLAVFALSLLASVALAAAATPAPIDTSELEILLAVDACGDALPAAAAPKATCIASCDDGVNPPTTIQCSGFSCSAMDQDCPNGRDFGWVKCGSTQIDCSPCQN